MLIAVFSPGLEGVLGMKQCFLVFFLLCGLWSAPVSASGCPFAHLSAIGKGWVPRRTPGPNDDGPTVYAGWKKDATRALQREDGHAVTALRMAFLPLVKSLADTCQAVTEPEIRDAIKKLQAQNYFSGPLPYDRFGSPVEALKSTGGAAGKDPEAIKYLERFLSTADYNVRKGLSYHVPIDEHRNLSGRFGSFLVALPKPGNPELKAIQADNRSMAEGLFPTLTPVGGYGEQFSRSLLFTAAILRSLAIGRLSGQAKAVAAEAPEIVQTETARGKESPDTGPLYTLLEGIVSMNQTISLLLAKKIPGKDYSEALKGIVLPSDPAQSNGAIVDFVRHLAMGVIGPITLKGWHYPEPVESSGGGLKLSPELLSSLGRIKEASFARHFQDYTSNKGRKPGQTAIACPMSTTCNTDPKAGLQHFAEGYYRVFLMVDKILKENEVARN